MNDILAKIKTNIIDKLPPNISKLLSESIKLSERRNYTESLRTLSECLFLLLREEYFIPAGLIYEDNMGVVEMFRELRNVGKDLGKSETDAILRIQEKVKQEDVDSIVMETCFEGAVSVFESYLREQGSKQQKKVEATSNKSPGRFIMEELEALFIESDSDKKIREHFPKIEEIYQDFPYDKEIRKMYLQFLCLVDKERAKSEILSYLESGEVTIHLGSVCITLLAEMGFLYDAKKKLGWYEQEFSGEKDGIFAELLVYLYTYIKDGREADRRRAEGLSDVFGSRKESFYTYIENCYLLFSERDDAIRQRSEGLYLYKENVFRERVNKSKVEIKAEEEFKKRESEAKKSKEIKESSIIRADQKKVEQIQIQERIIEPPIVESSSASSLDKTYTNSIGMEFVLIPAGEFMMGSVPQDKIVEDNEKPQHKVRITKPFYMGKYPVTQEEWEILMGSNPSGFKSEKEEKGLIFKKKVKQTLPKNPVESVNWNDCQEFIKKLNQKEGRIYRLPTEAEWEYSARGVVSIDTPSGYTVYTYGDDASLLGDYAWYDENSGNTTHPVGQKKPNSLGLYDMIGNVWEWCWDMYDIKYYTSSPSVDPKGASIGYNRVLRGGSWNYGAKSGRLSFRNYYNPEGRFNNYGFRLVLLP